MPRVVLLIASLFVFLLAYQYLRHPMRMWEKLLRPGLGGLPVSDVTGRRISLFMGITAALLGLALAGLFLLSLLQT
ncbi:MAG TPA: hypothetical protein VK188_04745 [Holophaga sp.]|nr:hypothetical protein [Holophaga sp.]